MIDLRYAKVTPGLTSSNKANNVFQIRYAIVEMHVNLAQRWSLNYLCSVDNQIYTLAAKDNSAAMNWIEKLQVEYYY